jgi:peptidoglycan/LPS O-acetylase OafA/YrhL
VTASRSDKIYFTGLNGIRAIAAMIVVILHTGQYLDLFGLKLSEQYKWFWHSYAVTLFFVLSGFLITYLLLEEKQRAGTVSLKEFYTRRILRIWPLYYLIIAITLLLYYFAPSLGLPEITTQELSLYAVLLANVAFFTNGNVTPLKPLWSIGVEEQFYAIWPVLIKKCTSVYRALFGVIAAYLAIKALCTVFCGESIIGLVTETRIDCMAIGGLGAAVLRDNKKIIAFIYSKITQYVCWAIFLFSTIFRPIHIKSSIDHELYSLLFIIIIINVSTNKATVVNLEKPLFDFLGRISYGLYVYHMLVILILKSLIKPIGLPQTWESYLAVYLSVSVVTIVISFLSYQYFERPFLKMKDKFSIVLSQASAKSS